MARARPAVSSSRFHLPGLQLFPFEKDLPQGLTFSNALCLLYMADLLEESLYDLENTVGWSGIDTEQGHRSESAMCCWGWELGAAAALLGVLRVFRVVWGRFPGERLLFHFVVCQRTAEAGKKQTAPQRACVVCLLVH